VNSQGPVSAEALALPALRAWGDEDWVGVGVDVSNTQQHQQQQQKAQQTYVSAAHVVQGKCAV